MIYFSELKGKKVVTEDNVEVGKAEDFIFLASEKPSITKFVVRSEKNENLIVSVNFLKKINNDILIAKDYVTSSLVENELYVLKNLLDKQIIDLRGNKIVRVNDVAIQDKQELYIAGVDTGILGILRWLKLEKLLSKIIRMLRLRTAPYFLSWADVQPLELSRGQVKLKKEQEKLEKLKPEDLADYLEKTNILNTRKILRIVNQKFAAGVIKSLNINYQTALFKQFSPERAAKVIDSIDSDEAVDILLTLSTKKRTQIIELLPEAKKKSINHLLNLSDTAIGRLLNTEYLAVYPENVVREVINKIKKETSGFFSLINVYVINRENQLIGVFNIHELLLQEPDTPVYKFMVQNLIVVHLTTPIEIVVRKMLKYKLVHLPVIDDEKKLLGLVLLSDTNEYILAKIG